jgi:hypothetical protein
MRDKDPTLLGLLAATLVFALAIASSVLDLAAPGPLWAKIVAVGVIVAACAGAAVWWHGFQAGRRRRP